MEGLTAKVFRTYNASITLQKQLDELTDPNASVPEKVSIFFIFVYIHFITSRKYTTVVLL